MESVGKTQSPGGPARLSSGCRRIRVAANCGGRHARRQPAQVRKLMSIKILPDGTASRSFDYSQTKPTRYRGLEKFEELRRPALANDSWNKCPFERLRAIRKQSQQTDSKDDSGDSGKLEGISNLPVNDLALAAKILKTRWRNVACPYRRESKHSQKRLRDSCAMSNSKAQNLYETGFGCNG